MKLNKYLAIFIGLFVSLNAILFVVFQKYYLLLLHHTIFYCQEMVKTLAVQWPSNTGIVVFSFLSLILLEALFKFFLTVIKIVRLKKNLTENIMESTLTTSLLNKLGLNSRVIVVHSGKPFAFCFGVRQPNIYLSTKLTEILSAQELEVVLLHEKYHLEHRDTLTLMV